MCRKRKDHEEEDFYENDFKFSKSSNGSGDGNSMSFLLHKWANNHVVKGFNVVQEGSDHEVLLDTQNFFSN